jgi:hypothetical protein
MKATTPRRKLIVIVLLVLSAVGAVVRYSAADPSALRDVGTLMMLLWLPVIGNVVGWIVERLRPRTPPPVLAFPAERPFQGQLLAQLTPLPPGQRPASQDLDAGNTVCALLCGTEGFTVRLAQPLVQWLDRGETQALEIEFLRPEVALPKLAPGTAFHVLAGHGAIGHGHVLHPVASE